MRATRVRHLPRGVRLSGPPLHPPADLHPGMDASVEPTAARIAEVSDLAKREGITTIFYETAVSPAVSQAIARDAGLRTDVLDPLEAKPTDTTRGADYLGVMRANLQSLRTANGCR
ncbi:hypothetical protein Rai3103_12545 [Raineyella fluvialis]|uniref:Zinc transport system substrate-binding protein n=1 Tax=Raineyella fluvialis TaxID=2662261 RepID=A0A5Q2FGW4_9ACTN|nr:hypothetical protein Rai3103_12545 [Raineyella fluvialis]